MSVGCRVHFGRSLRSLVSLSLFVEELVDVGYLFGGIGLDAVLVLLVLVDLPLELEPFFVEA